MLRFAQHDFEKALTHRALPIWHEDEEIENKQAEIERLTDAIAEAQAEAATWAAQLARFETEHTAFVTPYYARLDRWRLRCDEQQWMVTQLTEQRLRARQLTPPRPETVHGDLAAEFRAQRERLDEEAQTPPPPPPEPALYPANFGRYFGLRVKGGAVKAQSGRCCPACRRFSNEFQCFQIPLKVRGP